MKLIKTTEVTSIPHGVQTLYVALWLQHPTSHSNTPRETKFTMLKKILNLQHRVHL